MSLKSGLDAESQIVPGESPEEFAALQAAYFDRFKPTTPEQRFQLDNLIRNEWLIRRYHRVEAQLWEYQTSLCEPGCKFQLGQAFAKASTIFMRLHRRLTVAEKAYKEAMTQLTRSLPPSEPQQKKEKIEQLASFLTSDSEPLTDFAMSQMMRALKLDEFPLSEPALAASPQA